MNVGYYTIDLHKNYLESADQFFKYFTRATCKFSFQ